MQIDRWIRRTVPIAAVLLAGGVSALSAQERQLFQWRGTVDREVRITMHGGELWTSDDRGDDGRSRSRVAGNLPQRDGIVRVAVRQGRGDVDVVQQPRRRNDYTAILRVRDPNGGAARYAIDAYWQPTANDRDRDGRWDGDGRYDRGHDDAIPPRQRDRDDDSGWNRGGGGSWGSGSLHWSGNVDSDVEIRVQGRRVDYATLSGAPTRDVRTSFSGPGLPQQNVQLHVSRATGRGSVMVVQQPSAYNGYTAIIRIRDPQGGYGWYDFDTAW